MTPRGILFGLLACVLVTGCGKMTEPKPDVAVKSPIQPLISAVTVERQRFVPTVHCTGQILPAVGKECLVSSHVDGRVAKVQISPGSKVSKGQVLAYVESKEIGNIQGEVLEALSRLQIARAREDRERTLFVEEVKRPRGLISAQTHYDQAKITADLDHKQYERTKELVALKICAAKDLQTVEAAVQKDDLARDQAKAELERETRLYHNRAMIKRDLQYAQAETKTCLDNLAVLRQKLALMGVPSNTVDQLFSKRLLLAQLPIVAPQSGVLAKQAVAPGEVVSVGQMLFSICDLSTVQISCDLPEADVSAVSPGAEVTASVNAYPHQKFIGNVGFIGTQVNPETRTVPIRALVPNNDGRLRINMFAEVDVSTQPRVGILCPRAAIHEDGGESVVYLRPSVGNYRKQAVKTGLAHGDMVEVLSGLSPGDTVVTEGSILIKTELSYHK